MYGFGIMELAIYDNNRRLILLSVSQLSGMHSTKIREYIKNRTLNYYFQFNSRIERLNYLKHISNVSIQNQF